MSGCARVPVHSCDLLAVANRKLRPVDLSFSRVRFGRAKTFSTCTCEGLHVKNKGMFRPTSPAKGFEEPFLHANEPTPPTYDVADVSTLLLTICFQVSGTLLLKSSRPWLFVPAYALYFAGLSLFAFVLQRIPLAIAYTTWCALGTVGVTVASVVCYGEVLSRGKVACIASTVPFVVGMYVLP